MPIESVDVPQEETATNQEPTEENNNFGTFNTIMELLNAATPQESVPVMAQAQAKASSPYIVNRFDKGGSKKSGGSFYQTHRARWFNFLRKKGVDPVKAERLATYFSAQDSLESGHGTSDAARRKNNYGGMQRLDKKTNKMVNVSYGSIDDYMNAKWKMMNNKFGRALNAKNIQEYANILNDPKYHGKGYMYGLYEGYRDGQPLDVARQTKYMNDYTRIMMDIAGEKGFKGADVPDDLSIVQPENPYTQFIPFEPFNPQAFNNPQAFVAPRREQFEVKQPIIEAAKDYAYSPEQLEREERRQGLNNLSFILGMMNGGNGSSFADTIGMLTGNIAAEGGKIHIKPENRGKFTALKKRTGHSATWFKEHGTPAQRKMATFALNARHWKHGYGGNLYPNGGLLGALSKVTEALKAPSSNRSVYVTTGGAGYIPDFSTHNTVEAAKSGIFDGINALKERAYRTIVPQDYDIPRALGEFVRGNQRDLDAIEPVRNEEWARYLGVPYNGKSNFEPSPYRPVKGKTYKDVVRFKDESKVLSDDVIRDLIERQKTTGKNTLLVTGDGGGMGSYTLSLGEDENGKYASYYDDWDINPFKGVSASVNIPGVSNIEDIVPSSNPFTIYGRRYYKDKEINR